MIDFRWLKVIMLFLVATLYACERPHEVSSPDKKTKINVGVEGGRVYYMVTKNNDLLFDKSFLGFELMDGLFDRDFEIESATQVSFSEMMDQIRAVKPTADNYREMNILLKEVRGRKRKLSIRFRLYNDGLGFRYEFPAQASLEEFVVLNEQTEFNLVHNSDARYRPYGVGQFDELYLSGKIQSFDTVSSPLTIQTPDSVFLAIHELALTDYATMNLLSDGKTNRLKVFLTPLATRDGIRLQTPAVTPWRTITIADSAGELLLSRLMLNLNAPSIPTDKARSREGL